VFVRNRLMSRGQIDDAEPAHADRPVVACEDSFIVRATMADLIAHSARYSDIRRRIAHHESSNSAHIKIIAPEKTRRKSHASAVRWRPARIHRGSVQSLISPVDRAEHRHE